MLELLGLLRGVAAQRNSFLRFLLRRPTARLAIPTLLRSLLLEDPIVFPPHMILKKLLALKYLGQTKPTPPYGEHSPYFILANIALEFPFVPDHRILVIKNPLPFLDLPPQPQYLPPVLLRYLISGGCLNNSTHSSSSILLPGASSGSGAPS